ncbi:GNAT family N-acetyltransferase [Halosquirtibacter xylanolyticus]|uniref:GNAT family N-acetyltransferase n=1 Tax=Halosquirtibacter xylanolyticus TaxID=3374599 RepID=UPI00374821D8|nr:GNAT family N-acetyltransferase [Prolixibacteraceae bacterium]
MEKINVLVRRATLDDLDAIAIIVKAAVAYMNSKGNFQWSEDYPSKDVFVKDIENGELWVAELDNAVAGVAAINKDHTPEYDTLVWNHSGAYWGIHRIAISEAYKGRRIAESLFLKAESLSKASGDSYMRIDTNILNKPAQRLFERLGYGYCGQVYFAKTETAFVCYDKILE